MTRLTGRRPFGSLWFSLGAVLGVGIGGLSLSTASSQSDEIARLDRAREALFEELVRTRREAVATRSEIEAAARSREEAATREIARLDRARRELFEELVAARRETASLRTELHAAREAQDRLEVKGESNRKEQVPLAAAAMQTGPATPVHGDVPTNAISTPEEPRPAKTQRPGHASRILTSAPRTQASPAKIVRPKGGAAVTPKALAKPSAPTRASEFAAGSAPVAPTPPAPPLPSLLRLSH
jgi:chromosome segregation ATPase